MSNTIQQQHPLLMQTDSSTTQPLFLPVGTEVSAKFKGAFCEARVKKLIKSVRVKVQLKDPDSGTITTEESNLNASKIEVGQICEVQQTGKAVQKGQILSIKDCSMYTVIFDDGDERILKRNMLCPKSGRHFKDHETLNKLPLNNPEKTHYRKRKPPYPEEICAHDISTSSSGKKAIEGRIRRSASVSPLKAMGASRSATRRIAAVMIIHEESTRCASAADCPISSLVEKPGLDDSNSSGISTPDPEEEQSTSAAILSMQKKQGGSFDGLDKHEGDAMKEPIKQQETGENLNTSPPINSRNLLSKKFPPRSAVIINELTNQSGKIKLGMVVSMDEYQDQCKIPIQTNEDGIPIRSFHNGRYHIVATDCINFFDPSKSENLIDFGSSGLKQAFQHANRYISKGELPASWQKKVQTISHSSAETIEEPKFKEKPKNENVIKKKTNPEKIKLKKLERDKNDTKHMNTNEEAKSRSEQNEMNALKNSSELTVVDQMTQPVESEFIINKQSRQTSSSVISENECSDCSDSEEEEDASEEAKSNLVAHYYKFQEESGNEDFTPKLAGNDVDIYCFYNAVNKMGGHKQVTQKEKWEHVLRKLKVGQIGSQCDAAEVREIYLLYFEKFEAFMKNLGDSAVASFANSSGNQRNTRIIRTIATPSVVSAIAQADKKRTKEQKSSSTEKSLTGGSAKSRSRSGSVKDPSPAISIKSSTIHEEIISSESISTGSGRQKFTQERRLSFSDDGNTCNFANKTEMSLPKECGVNTKIAQKTLNSTNSEHQRSTQKISLPSSSPSSQKSTTSESLTLKMKLEPMVKEEPSSTSSSQSTSAQIAGKLYVQKKRLSGHESTAGSTSNLTKKAMQKPPKQRGRKPKLHREDRVKSPSGHKAVIEDIGYSNAHIFTRFYQGQNVHARHHLRFYDARVITVKQPSLTDIANSLRNAFELSRITHQGYPDLEKLTIENMGSELKDALRNLINSTKIFVHYLGWNSRYDEWLMLNKIRVDEKDERASSKQLEHLIPTQLPPALVAIALDWCTSSDGILSLASLTSAQSLEQRPRRLSSSAVAKTQQSHGSTDDGSSLLPRKHSNTTMGYRSPLNPSMQHHPSSSFTSSSMVHSSTLYTGISQSLSKFTIPHLPSAVVVKDECPELEGISTSNVPAKQPQLDNSKQIEPHKTNVPQQEQLTPTTQIPVNSSCQLSASGDGTFEFIKTDVEPLQQSRSDTESPFQLPPPPAPPILTPTKLLEQQQLLASPEILAGNEVNLQVHFHRNEVSACKEIKWAVSNFVATKHAFTMRMTEFLSTDLSQEMTNLKNPVKEEQSRAASPTLLSTNKKRKNASGEIAGAMSPPSKLTRQGIKSPSRLVHGLTGRSPMRPNETSDEEDNSFEGNQVESLHSIRQRVLNRLEADNDFNGEEYLGLPNIDEMLAACLDDPDKQVSLIEGRMRQLHSIYHESKSRLAELDRQERQHRKSLAARKVQTAALRGKATTTDD